MPAAFCSLRIPDSTVKCPPALIHTSIPATARTEIHDETHCEELKFDGSFTRELT
ncbi:hypothetical protein SAMN05216299_11725 [Nitrosospira sp. Nsp14]|nr:hypothetical protein SAMN05216299_11725 [Nitrosospira sp. Nsp14]